MKNEVEKKKTFFKFYKIKKKGGKYILTPVNGAYSLETRGFHLRV